jgi:hypothetical protein
MVFHIFKFNDFMFLMFHSNLVKKTTFNTKLEGVNLLPVCMSLCQFGWYLPTWASHC